ncbi:MULTISPECIES: hypothetical protein [Marinifilum]|nr:MULTISPECIES: hypothetical protein [Marinifilum]
MKTDWKLFETIPNEQLSQIKGGEERKYIIVYIDGKPVKIFI